VTHALFRTDDLFIASQIIPPQNGGAMFLWVFCPSLISNYKF